MKKRVIVTALATGALLVSAAAPASAAGHEPGTIVDVAVAASGGGAPDSNPYDYDLLVQAVLYTGLEGVLGDPNASFTVFAPNDQAFLTLVTDLTGVAPASEAEALTTIVTALSRDQISNVLLYHVTAGNLGKVDVNRAKSLTMANGGIVNPRGVNLRDEGALTDPRIVRGARDIQTSNGVIHTIDRVLIPGNL
ncbi:putative surface protein with fasciclin (FAS1) repeats [Marisediminicola sp. UYEF4]|uniref:fasciclin domain-containing protein n=1 Tax=Marisediminicola sp. UYEF4 TaxID=1756384 RepID=UPI00339389C6